jgi:hypothetical protein
MLLGQDMLIAACTGAGDISLDELNISDHYWAYAHVDLLYYLHVG